MKGVAYRPFTGGRTYLIDLENVRFCTIAIPNSNVLMSSCEH